MIFKFVSDKLFINSDIELPDKVKEYFQFKFVWYVNFNFKPKNNGSDDRKFAIFLHNTNVHYYLKNKNYTTSQLLKNEYFRFLEFC